MANINYKDILDFNGITTREDVLTVDYTTETGRGRFVVLLPDRFPTTAHNMKLFIDMFLKSGNPEETARGLYEYLKKCSDYLTDFRNRIEGINDTEKKDRAALAAAIKKYNSNIEALCKVFAFDQVQDTEAIKMQKTDVVTVIYDRAKNAPAAVPEADQATTAPTEVNQEPETARPEPVKDPDINNAINIYYNNDKYTIIAAPHGRCDVIYQDTCSYFTMSITVNGYGVIERYFNGTRTYYKDKYFKNEGVTLLYELYMKLLNLGLLPEYKPSDTTRDNIKGIYNRHNTAPASYTMQLYKAILYYRLITDQRRPETVHNGILCNNGIKGQTRQKKAITKLCKGIPRHYITPVYTEVNQTPGQLRSRYGITTALYNRIQAAPPRFQAPRANIPPYYNTS